MQEKDSSHYPLDAYGKEVEQDLRAILSGEPKLELYRMIEYFLGFRDQSGREVARYGGKRLRPAICLYIADLFGKKDIARRFASSLELFHNFTLIHDDIEDHDELRRGRPTVWKLWGVNHGINSGDALALLATKTLTEAAAAAGDAGRKIASLLSETYRQVIEGQFRDFTLADSLLHDHAVNEDAYMAMIERKSAVLIAGAAKAGALAGGAPAGVQRACVAYGLNIGMAYQIYDDIVSIWGSVEKSGKTALKDIYEKKKTLPVIYGYSMLGAQEKTEFEKIYAAGFQVLPEHVQKIVSCLNAAGAREYAEGRLKTFSDAAKKALLQTGFSPDQLKPLADLVDKLLYLEAPAKLTSVTKN